MQQQALRFFDLSAPSQTSRPQLEKQKEINDKWSDSEWKNIRRNGGLYQGPRQPEHIAQCQTPADK